MKEQWNDNSLKRRYERVYGQAMADNFTAADLENPYLDKITVERIKSQGLNMVRLAYYLGQLRAIASVDEGKTPVVLDSVQTPGSLGEKYTMLARNLSEIILKSDNGELGERMACEIVDALNDSASTIETLENLERNLREDNALLLEHIAGQSNGCKPDNDSSVIPLEQLRSIEFDYDNRLWIWIEVLNSDSEDDPLGYYQMHMDYSRGRGFCFGHPGCSYLLEYENYGTKWLAYWAQPSKEENIHD